MAESSHSPDDSLIGRTVAGRYRVISKLGEGGMGVTYRAWDDREGRPVVLKMPRRNLIENAAFAERFSREVRMMAALSHPSIVPILDVGEDEGLPILVMRFLPGGSLSNRRLRDTEGKVQPMQPSTLHLWLPAVASALDFVHANGIVHRDVKPANIFFDAFWGAYLGDFGIAKIVEDTTVLEKEHTLTATSMAIGTQEYMAPEQFTPKAVVDGRVDQYALAVMVYEILVGKRPFRGETAHVVVEVTTQPVPRFTQFRRDLPDSVCQAVYRGLSKQPGERFASCAEFAQAVLRDVRPMADEEGVARLLCPQCGNMLKMPTSAAGRQGKCPRCKTEMMVAEDLGALWLAREEHEGEEPAAAGAGQQESREDSVDVFTSISSTTPVPKAGVRGIWSQLDPTVKRVGIGAALLASLVATALLAGDYAAGAARKQLEAATASQKKVAADNERLENKLKKLESDNALLTERRRELIAETAALAERLDEAKSPSSTPDKEPPVDTPVLEPTVALSAPEKKQQKIPDPVFYLNFSGDWSHAQTTRGLRKVNVLGNPRIIDGARGPGLHLGMDSHLEIDLTDVVPLGDIGRTTALWVRTHRLSQQNLGAYLCYGAGREQYDSWSMCLGSDTYYFCGGGRDGETGKKPTLGVWEHLAWVKRDDTTELWVNGVVSGKVTGPLNTKGSMLLLGKSIFKNRKIEADIDEVGIWDVALKLEEIRGLLEGTRQSQSNPEETENKAPSDRESSAGEKPSPTDATFAGEGGAESPDTLSNSIGMKLKAIRGGTFRMADQKSLPVTITKPFYLGMYEVTNAEWRRVMGDPPSKWRDDARPVEQVSWSDAMEFCRKLSTFPEEQKAGRAYRLPTEAEWEYACRAGTTSQFSFGDDESRLGEFAWYRSNAGGQTHPVGGKKPNAWGLHDMHGNVFEWLSDWNDDRLSGGVDPVGSTSGSNPGARGGSWVFDVATCRSSALGRYAPSYRFHGLGFRVACSQSVR